MFIILNQKEAFYDVSGVSGRVKIETLCVTGAAEADGLAGSEAIALLDAAQVALVGAGHFDAGSHFDAESL